MHLVVVPAVGFGFPFRFVWLSASFAIFELLTPYVSVLMLLMRGYFLKCTYTQIFHIYLTLVMLYFNTMILIGGIEVLNYNYFYGDNIGL